MVPQKLTQWFNRPVEDYGQSDDDTSDYKNKVYRLPTLEIVINEFAEGSGVEETVALILGAGEDGGGPEFGSEAAALLRQAEKFPKLRGLFLAELEQEECEISWIEQAEVGPYLSAFPGLEDFRIRGGNGLVWTPGRHIGLKKLIIETGGMPTEVLEGILESVLPELEHLELWLGTEGYGWDGNAEDVRPFLYHNPFPKLKYLGLRNCDHQDEIAELAAEAPILDQLEKLDLSLGILTDRGAEALLNSKRVRKLKSLDLHHNYMSKEVLNRFRSLGIAVDVSDNEKPSEDRDDYYVSVGE